MPWLMFSKYLRLRVSTGVYSFINASNPAEKPTFWGGEPSNVVYSFVLGIK
jgi:hypothetical protein